VLIPNTDKLDVFISPTTFNVVLMVVALFNVVFPETFKVDTNVEGLLNLSMLGGLILHYNSNLIMLCLIL
jgi:hypothetical protein